MTQPALGLAAQATIFPLDRVSSMKCDDLNSTGPADEQWAVNLTLAYPRYGSFTHCQAKFGEAC